MAKLYLNQRQVIFTLSNLAGLASFHLGTVEKLTEGMGTSLENSLSCAAPDIGPWKVVWGPAIFQATHSKTADNSMFIVKHQDKEEYVIAIAGTNPISFYSWFFEDFNIVKTVPWSQYGSPPVGQNPQISRGTSIGLNHLLHLEPLTNLPGGGKTLEVFLGETLNGKPGPVDIITCGHSLGGALAPTVALYLHDNADRWAGQAQISLHSMPSAGPTPGDAAFACYYNSVLGATTQRIYNTLDMVPHVWAESDLRIMPGIYEPLITPDKTIHSIVDLLRAAAFNKNYTHVQTSQPLPGSLLYSQANNCKSPLSNWLKQAIQQHTFAYNDLLKVPNYLASSSGILQNDRLATFVAEGEELINSLLG